MKEWKRKKEAGRKVHIFPANAKLERKKKEKGFSGRTSRMCIQLDHECAECLVVGIQVSSVTELGVIRILELVHIFGRRLLNFSSNLLDFVEQVGHFFFGVGVWRTAAREGRKALLLEDEESGQKRRSSAGKRQVRERKGLWVSVLSFWVYLVRSFVHLFGWFVWVGVVANRGKREREQRRGFY
jgi:hypothetical protein